MIDTVHKALKIQRLTSLVYHLAFPLELLLQEFVAILFLALQGPVKNVENQDSHFAHALLINFRDKINFHWLFRAKNASRRDLPLLFAFGLEVLAN